MVCDIGGGTTDVALFSLADVVAGRSIRIAGDEMDEAIVEYLKQHYSLRVGTPTAEQLKIQIGSAAPLDQELSAEVRGRDTISGVPRKAVVTSEEIRDALREPVAAILNCLKSVIEQCDPELVADLVDNGIVLTGGGALLRGLDVFLSEQLNVPVRVDSDPLTTVARGAAICVDHLALWRHALDAGDGNA
jgi:rod shape-determining protein MreB